MLENEICKKILHSVLTSLVMVMLLGCDSNDEPLRLATYTYATNNRLVNMKPLSMELEGRLQRKVEMVSYPDVQSLIDGIKSDAVDIAMINTLGYLMLSSENEYMLPVANMHIKEDASDNYKTALLTTNDSISDYFVIEELAETLKMMFVKEGSTSGNLVPRLLLSSINIPVPESRFKEVIYGGDHTTTFEKLVNGNADLCAIGSNEYFKQMQADSTLEEKVRLLWLSDEIPLGPVLVNIGLSAGEREIILDVLLNLHSENPDAFNSIKAGWSEAKQSDKFQGISDDYYDSFREVNGNATQLSNILRWIDK